MAYFLFLIAIAGLTMGDRICEKGEYLDIRTDTCFSCSTSCPDNQVVRRTCGPYNDIECGPLVELSAFFEELSNEKSQKTQPAPQTSHEMHVASMETNVHENDTVMHVLLIVLLLLTCLIIVLTAVALVMYRRRNSHIRKIADPEGEMYNNASGEVLMEKNSFIENDKVVLVTALLKPEK